MMPTPRHLHTLLILGCTALLPLSCSQETTPPNTQTQPLPQRCSPLVFAQGSPDAPPSIVGSFNLWDPSATPMVDSNGDGTYQARIPYAPGPHTYMIARGGTWSQDTNNPLTLFERGEERSWIELPNCDAPDLELNTQTTTPNTTVRIVWNVLNARSQTPIDPASLKAHITVSPNTQTIRSTERGDLVVQYNPELNQISVETDALRPHKYTLFIEGTDQDGHPFPLKQHPFWIEDTPFDWRDAFIYQVFVDRFRTADDTPLSSSAPISYYRGGHLDGITRTIEDGYFDALGVNVLWISPIYQNPEGAFVGRDGNLAEPYHGYWPSDPHAIEDRFGGLPAAHRLVETAHRHGIRVILDTVLNHLHVEHPYHNDNTWDTWFNNPDGDCICGVTCSWGTDIQTCWFDPFLADLNWTRYDVVQTMISDAVEMTSNLDLDGLRLDAVPMLPRLAFRHLRHALQQRFGPPGADMYLLGETFTSRGNQALLQYPLGPHTLSGQFDFPVMWALRDALARRIPMSELESEIAASQSAWNQAGALMAPIIGNHDVPRFISDVHGDPLYQPRELPPPQPTDDTPYQLQRLALTFLLTHPGAPVLYYGDEIALAGAYDPDNRRNMRFLNPNDPPSQASQTLDHTRRLGQARACSNALRRGTRRTLISHEEFTLYARDAQDGAPAIIALNRSDLPRDFSFTLPDNIPLNPSTQLRDLFQHETLQNQRTLSFTVPPRSQILLLDTSCTTP